MPKKKDTPAEVGFEIRGTFYPLPSSYTLGEARLIKRVTGLDLEDFARQSASNPDVFAAVLLIAMQRVDPAVTIEDVESLDLEEIAESLRDPDDVSDADPTDPPPADEGEAPSSGD